MKSFNEGKLRYGNMRLEYLTEEPPLIIRGLALTIRPNCFSTLVSAARVVHCGNENYRLLMCRRGLANYFLNYFVEPFVLM
jgi:hypothetical protein